MKLADFLAKDKRYGVHFEMTLRGLSEREADEIAKQLGGVIVRRKLTDRGEYDDQIEYQIDHTSLEEAEYAWERLRKLAGQYIDRARLIK